MKDRIKQLRKALNLTQEELGTRLAVKKSAVSMWENGAHNVSDIIIASICREFRVSEEWLRTGAGEMFAPEPKDELDKLFDAAALIPQYRVVLRQLFALPESDQRKVVEWLRATVAEMEEEEPEIDPIEAEIEAYRQELLAEKEAAEKPSASAESVG